MLFNNYKIGQKVLITDILVTAEVLGIDPISQLVSVRTLEDYYSHIHKKLVKAGVEVNLPEYIVKPYYLN